MQLKLTWKPPLQYTAITFHTEVVSLPGNSSQNLIQKYLSQTEDISHILYCFTLLNTTVNWIAKSPSLEVFKTQLEKAMANLALATILFVKGGCSRWLPEAPSHQHFWDTLQGKVKSRKQHLLWTEKTQCKDKKQLFNTFRIQIMSWIQCKKLQDY